ncbi:MAG: hypothetical protein GF317_22525 [Candidatus Lokiarchaeota archaeon]|nr:hypothetical protein [Candidatus Lokiarchaeota archaeon]MBD3202237.1 hypothetical protein [Candidatus Lokiarchaeota archaeon]
MSDDNIKTLYVNVKELSFKEDQHVDDLTQFLTEEFPQLEIAREGNEIEINMPSTLSNRAIKLRIKKFLYKKNLKEGFRPISLTDPDKEGYTVKERKQFEFTYY